MIIFNFGQQTIDPKDVAYLLKDEEAMIINVQLKINGKLDFRDQIEDQVSSLITETQDNPEVEGFDPVFLLPSNVDVATLILATFVDMFDYFPRVISFKKDQITPLNFE